MIGLLSIKYGFELTNRCLQSPNDYKAIKYKGQKVHLITHLLCLRFIDSILAPLTPCHSNLQKEFEEKKL